MYMPLPMETSKPICLISPIVDPYNEAKECYKKLVLKECKITMGLGKY